MPIQFPRSTGPERLFERQWLLNLRSKFFNVVPAPNIARVGTPLNSSPGSAAPRIPVNVRQLKTMYQAPDQTAVVNPVRNAAQHERRDSTVSHNRIGARLTMSLSGVSRDSAGATLGNCQVLIFRTLEKTLVSETLSDGSGNWTTELLAPLGNVFIVEYKVGAPDLFGTSPNTNTASAVNQ